MINKTKLQQAKDLWEFSSLEKEMSMSDNQYNQRLNGLRIGLSEARKSGDEEEIKFYTGLINELKNDMREQLDWEDSVERYHMMEKLALSDFVKSTFRMKAGDK